MEGFGKQTTADQVAEVLKERAEGRLFLITGGYGGLGAQTAKSLAKAGGRVVVAGRSQASLDAFLGENEGMEGDVLDLADLESVRQFAQRFLERHETLDVLVCNAGLMNTPKGQTKQGFETQWGVNVVGHFLLAKLLLPAVKAAPQGRMVFLSSVGHACHGAARLNLE